MKTYRWSGIVLCMLLPTAAMADFHYQETTQVTGGSMLGLMKMAGAFSRQGKKAGQPTVSTVYVQGNKMARMNAQSLEIINLDNETITNVNLENHTYTQMTFAALRQQMQEIAQRTKQQPSPNQPKIDFKVNVRNTGATKQVGGLNASEAILTMQMEGTDMSTRQQGAMAMTNDMWLVPDIPGYDEVREFNKKLAVKMGDAMGGGGMSSAMAAMQPGMAKGMANMAKQVSQLKGVPVEQVMRMGTTTNGEPLSAASEAPPSTSSSGPNPQALQEQNYSAGDAAKQSAVSSIESKFGGFGFGGFGRKKKQSPPSDINTDSSSNAQHSPQRQAQAASVLMESKTDLTSFSSAPIDATKFSVPAGFTQVQLQRTR